MIYKKITFISVFVIVFIIILVASFYYFNNFQEKETSSKKTPSKIIKVGNEIITESDYQYELNLSAVNATRDQIINKLINDSIILQFGVDNKLINSDEKIISDSNKNHRRRKELVEQVLLSQENQSDTIEGEIISIWFFNNEIVGPKGYEESKNISYKIIEDIHTKVLNKELTMHDASLKLLDNRDVADLDPAYKSNIYRTFKRNLDEKIISDEVVDSAIKTIKLNTVSDIMSVHDSKNSTGKMIEACYVFFVINNKYDKGIKFDKSDWINSLKLIYKIQYI